MKMTNIEKSFYETIKKYDKLYKDPDYHNFDDKTLQIFTKAFSMICPEIFLERGIALYEYFCAFLQAVEFVVRHGWTYEEVADIIKTDKDVLKKAVEYVKSFLSERDIILCVY